MEIAEVRQHFWSQTRRIKAGNISRKGCVSADLAMVGREFVVSVSTDDLTMSSWLSSNGYKKTKISEKVVRYRKLSS